MLNVTLIPILEDNYTYIIQSGNDVGIVDPGDAAPIINKLEELDLTPNYIFNTHHHWDHVNGNKKIKDKYNCRLVAPQEEQDKIKDIDIGLSHGEMFQFGGDTIEVIKVSGHTNGHICFYFQNSKILFSGDALFAMGCGRLFEGNATDLFEGFQHLKKLPDDTQVYCGHEYTLTNANFCLSVEPDNTDIISRTEEIKSLRAAQQPTIPTTIALEKQTNLFFRAKTAKDLKILRDLKDKS